MEKDTLVKLIIVVSILLISLAVVAKLNSLSKQTTNQQLCRMSILKAWKGTSFSILNPNGRFKKPGFVGCKTTFAVINKLGIYEGKTLIVDFSEVKDKNKINNLTMKFLADEMAKCWSTFYEGGDKIFDYNDIMKRTYGDTGAICITCDDINIEYLPYGEINYSDFINFLKNNYLNISSDSGQEHVSYYDYLYKAHLSDLNNVQVTLLDRFKTNLHNIVDLRKIFRSWVSSGVSSRKIIATILMSVYPTEDSTQVYLSADEPKGYLSKLGNPYNPEEDIFFSCDDKNNLYLSSSKVQLLSSDGYAYCYSNNKETLTCINKTVYKINGLYCSGKVIMNCTKSGPEKIKVCKTSCKYGQCTKPVKVSNSNRKITEGDYNILFYVVGRPIYMKKPVPFVILINTKDLFNSCDWLSLR